MSLSRDNTSASRAPEGEQPSSRVSVANSAFVSASGYPAPPP
ncbi:hypothetical protein ACXZ65_28125 [Streptomyces aculeolatus]